MTAADQEAKVKKVPVSDQEDRISNTEGMYVSEARAWKSVTNGRGPWWNSGASHMASSRQIISIYYWVTALYTLSVSIIWGINTLFLMDAGLDIFQVMIVNAFFTAGTVIFEVPTGVVADTVGRKVSFLLANDSATERLREETGPVACNYICEYSSDCLFCRFIVFSNSILSVRYL